MDKPTKPTITLPSSFGGTSTAFSSDKILTGYQEATPEIVAGDNLNYLIDQLSKGINYNKIIADFINDCPIGKVVSVDSNNKLVYVDLNNQVNSDWNATSGITQILNKPSLAANFSMNSGNIDSSGNADILNYSGTTLSFKVGGSYPSLALTYADKSQETLTSIPNITGLSTNGTYNIVKEKGVNTPYLAKNLFIQKTKPVASQTSYNALTSSNVFGTFDGSYPLANFIDGSLSTEGNTSGSPFGIITTTTQKVQSIKFNIGSQSSSWLRYFDLEYSIDNGTTWIKLFTSPDSVSGWNEISVPTYPLGARLRINNALSWMGTTNNFSIWEFYFMAVDTVGTGDIWLNTSTEPLKSYKHNGTAFVETQCVPLGTVTVAGGVITSVSTNSYNQNGYDVNIPTLNSLSGYRFPDYSNGVSKAWNTLYTASSDGWVWVMGDSINNALQLYINGIIISYTNGNSVSGWGLAPVSNGDTYKGLNGTSGQTIKFYPAKGAN